MGFVASPRGALDGAALPRGFRTTCGSIDVAAWGVEPLAAGDPVLVLSKVVRTAAGSVDPAAVLSAARTDLGRLSSLVPPFAAVAGDSRGLRIVADAMGLRQLYHSLPGAGGPGVLSSSALVAGAVRGATLDLEGAAVQLHLGWQLGQRTLLEGICKLAPGATARLDDAGLATADAPIESDSEIAIDDAVRSTAGLLRMSLSALLDEFPDAVLQLTGGQDSRLLLSAIPVARRRGLRAMTLRVPGSGDVEVASGIARAYGLEHEVHDLPDLDGLDPEQAWERCRSAAGQLDGLADPIALAALTLAEARFSQGVRISGLGGEVARGFYYMGHVGDRTFDEADARRLAAWRMFANEAAEGGILEPSFARWSREIAEHEVYIALRSAGDEWFRATDALYLRHRMQRWAGVTETAVGAHRAVVNPMLDPSFLDVARRLAPVDKARSRFLARLQMELDPELGRMPMDGRPAPQTYARPSARGLAAQSVSTSQRLARKAIQRLRGDARPPAGGAVLTRRIVEHWRQRPEVLTMADRSGIVSPAWIEDVLAARVEPRPSSVAFVANLLVAEEASASRGTFPPRRVSEFS